MSIDKLLKELKDEENSEKMPESISERCWENIKDDIKLKQSWYDKLCLKVHNVNRKYHLKVAFQIVLGIFVLAAMPTVFKETKLYVQNSAFFNKTQQNDPIDNQINKDNSLEEMPEYKETDENYLKALEKVREIAQKRYSKFSLYSSGQLIKDKQESYYIIRIYENTTGGKIPEAPDEFKVDANSLEVKSVFDETTIDKYFSQKVNLEQRGIYMDDIPLLINKADNLKLTSDNDVYLNIDLYTNLKGKVKKANSKIPEYAYCYKEQPDIYYTYEEKEQSLYRFNTNNNEKKLIYKYNPKEYSILTLEEKTDIDGDGKEDYIKFDPLRLVLSVNNVSICVTRGETLKSFQIVDVNNKKPGKEIFIYYQSANDYSSNSIYTYKNGVIKQLVTQGGIATIDGSGKVVFKDVRSQFFQTHSSDFEYQYYKDDSLRIVYKDLYEAKKISEDKGASSYQIIKPKKQIKTYKDKNSKEIAVVLKVGEKIKLIGYDESNWVLVENSEGIRGWIEVNSTLIKQLNLNSFDVFEGLIFAG
jgi:hypothetical protein